MTHRVRSAFGRFLALGAVLAVAATFAAPVAAQQTTGKIEGTVTDQAGVPLANAQVFVVGTSFGAVTNDRGYYFINNVPVGGYTLRAQFIGYAPMELREVRVFGGQTMTQNVRLTPSAIQVGGVSVEAANPIVPRDQVTSKTIVSGDLINSLPIDDVRNIIAIQPGVVESGSGNGVSIRGGRPGEANVYIDGAPVRSTNFGNQAITVGTNAVEEASVTTGALGVDFGDAQSGVISYTTRTGGSQLEGSVSYTTDEPFGNTLSVGFNRFEGSIGGPVPSISNLRFFVSSVVQGQVTRFRGTDFEKVPTFVLGATDTTVTDNDGNSVDVPTYIQYGGQCDAAANFGQACNGRQAPFDWLNDVKLQGKLSYSYGSGSSIALSGLASGQQGRVTPGGTAGGVGGSVGNPLSFTGFHNWQRLYVLNLNHSVYKRAESELAINVNLSLGQDRGMAGPLDPASEANSRDPSLGLTFTTLNFRGISLMPFPLSDDIIRNVRSNSGLRTPYLNQTGLRNIQPYRTNPYGLASGFPTQGEDGTGTLNSENRYRGFVNIDWQANRFHRFHFGGEFKKTDLAYYNSGFITQIFMDLFHVKPVTWSLWADDRLDLGDVVLELGGRYDFMDSKALFADTPGRIFTNPAYAAASNYDAALAAVFTPAEKHTTLSPVLRVSFPITEKTDFRLSYAHQVQTPDFLTLLSGSNNDFSFTNTNDAFGRDVGFGKTIQFEFGVRHAFNPDLVFDVSAYNKDFVSELAYRIKPFSDPANPGDVVNVNVLTTGDFGYARGIDFKLDKRIGAWLDFSGGYTFQVARSTGSDPFSYLRTTSRQISAVTGDRIPPPEQALPTDDNRTHNFVGSLALHVPNDWRPGTTLGAILRNVGAFASLRAVSGLPYTRQKNTGAGATAPRQGFGLTATSVEPVNSSNLPWTKYINLTVNKGISLGRADVLAFVDVRNLFDFRNVIGLFVETDDVVNALNREQVTSPAFASLRNEASQNGKLLAGGAIDLRPSCGTWTGSTPGPVNCAALRQVEARYGDGDRVYTLDEQTAALNAFYDRFNGPQTFYDQPRHIRLGLELKF